MSFNTEIPPEVEKDLKKLPKKTQQRIKDKIVQAQQNPRHFYKHLTGIPFYELRIGKYRVISRIDFSQEKIYVWQIGHKKNIRDEISL